MKARTNTTFPRLLFFISKLILSVFRACEVFLSLTCNLSQKARNAHRTQENAHFGLLLENFVLFVCRRRYGAVNDFRVNLGS